MQLEQQPATTAFSSRSGSIHCRHEHAASIRHAAAAGNPQLIPRPANPSRSMRRTAVSKKHCAKSTELKRLLAAARQTEITAVPRQAEWMCVPDLYL
jgi:hypothetical protein